MSQPKRDTTILRIELVALIRELAKDQEPPIKVWGVEEAPAMKRKDRASGAMRFARTLAEVDGIDPDSLTACIQCGAPVTLTDTFEQGWAGPPTGKERCILGCKNPVLDRESRWDDERFQRVLEETEWFSKHPSGRDEGAGLSAPEDEDGEDAARGLVAGAMTTRLSDHIRSCAVLIREAQDSVSPDNALIAVLCDSVRLARSAPGRRHWRD